VSDVRRGKPRAGSGWHAWYLAGVAILAAALSDPLVESLANRGWLGGPIGQYHDNDHTSVLPALVLGALVALSVGIRRALVRGRARSADADWMPQAFADLSLRLGARDVVWIVGLQFVALFAMESFEQLTAAGAGADGTWLGGPAFASIAIHVVVGTAIAALSARAVRSASDVFTSLVRAAIALALTLGTRSPSGFRARRDTLRVLAFARVFVPQEAGRAPPPHAAR
jgi:hypothetical protein